ncbi:imidazole glycerol phosphate synthase subunit HisH [Sphingomonas panacis]|uniref:Imidazole glycerol phosphate synthase subunit HisH n=1 Tax=Sphingomonas panacis TaxID=1560345 RepID=A0A1B3ZAI3_9SPHN|nr:imidazole glycerol phosphate synthase subunit HisH [Sphingomonas panacis]AOH84435.1 imidazole glycerol phosphate synthase subunit HisH [Sphingomonas panacis]
MTLALIDYGAGNLHSVANALKAAGASDIVITADADVVAHADRIVLPGVGAFAACASALRAVPGMVEAMERRVRGDGVPFLGICVGMQLLAETGEEFGVHPGLGWVAGSVRRLTPADPAAKVPHMGWNDVVPVVAHPLIVPGEAYFLHSYAFEGADVVATSDHAGPVVAAIGRDNILGVQFHPEKSQVYGLAFLRRFLTWAP